MVSVITPTYGTNRVDRISELYYQIKLQSSISVQHVIVVDGNQGTYNLLKERNIGDTLLLLPKNVEWTKAINIGEKFALHPYLVSMDDDTHILISDLFGKALEIFKEKFPDGNGVLGFSTGESNCPEFLTTRKYAYNENMGNFVWNEYWHEGDYEVFLKATSKGQYHWSSELKVEDRKINDLSRTKSLQCVEHDAPLLALRKSAGFPNQTTEYSFENERIKYLKENYYNL